MSADFAQFIALTVLVLFTVGTYLFTRSDDEMQMMWNQLIELAGGETIPVETKLVTSWCQGCDHIYEDQWMQWHYGAYMCSGCCDGPRPPGYPEDYSSPAPVEPSAPWAILDNQVIQMAGVPPALVGKSERADVEGLPYPPELASHLMNALQLNQQKSCREIEEKTMLTWFTQKQIQ